MTGEIKKGRVFCCGNDLGEYNKKKVYWCDICKSIILTTKHQNLMKWIKEGSNDKAKSSNRVFPNK